MARRPKFALTFAPQAIEHLDRKVMRIAPLADVKARLSAYVDECVADGPIVITRNGKAVAVLLVPNDDDDLERILLERSPRFQAMLNRSRQSIKEGEGLSEKDYWKAVRKRAQERKSAAAADRAAKR
jgi:prevent-host-death family protein